MLFLKNLEYGQGSSFSMTKVLSKGAPELCEYILIFATDVGGKPAVGMTPTYYKPKISRKVLVLYGFDCVVWLVASRND